MKVLLAIALLCWSPLAFAGEIPHQHTVHVSGEYHARTMPDMAQLDITVYGQAQELQDAKAKADDLLAKVKQLLADLDIAKEHIHTTGLRVQPSFRWLEGGKRELEHYEAVYDIKINIYQLDKVGVIVQQLVSAGVDRINQVQYTLKDDAAVKQKALYQAVQHAKDKAQVLADAAERKLGKAITIQEQSVHYQPPVMSMRMMAMEAIADKAGEEAPPVGELDIQAQVSIIYELQN